MYTLTRSRAELSATPEAEAIRAALADLWDLHSADQVADRLRAAGIVGTLCNPWDCPLCCLVRKATGRSNVTVTGASVRIYDVHSRPVGIVDLPRVLRVFAQLFDRRIYPDLIRRGR